MRTVDEKDFLSALIEEGEKVIAEMAEQPFPHPRLKAGMIARDAVYEL